MEPKLVAQKWVLLDINGRSAPTSATTITLSSSPVRVDLAFWNLQYCGTGGGNIACYKVLIPNVHCAKNFGCLPIASVSRDAAVLDRYHQQHVPSTFTQRLDIVSYMDSNDIFAIRWGLVTAIRHF